jgi:hypothetical protein
VSAAGFGAHGCVTLPRRHVPFPLGVFSVWRAAAGLFVGKTFSVRGRRPEGLAPQTDFTYRRDRLRRSYY